MPLDQHGLGFEHKFHTWNYMHIDKFREVGCDDVINNGIYKALNVGYQE